MTRLTLRLLCLAGALCLGLVGAVVLPQEAQACSCSRSTRQSAAERADAVFTGRVLARADVRRPAPGRTDFRFEVSRVYKGSVYREQVVASVQGTDGCGFDFDLDSDWLVFAEERVEGKGDAAIFRLFTEQCSGNLRGTGAPRTFGPGRTPLNGESDREEKAVLADARANRLLRTGGLLTLGLVAVVGVGLVVLWRPGRSRA